MDIFQAIGIQRWRVRGRPEEADKDDAYVPVAREQRRPDLDADVSSGANAAPLESHNLNTHVKTTIKPTSGQTTRAVPTVDHVIHDESSTDPVELSLPDQDQSSPAPVSTAKPSLVDKETSNANKSDASPRLRPAPLPMEDAVPAMDLSINAAERPSSEPNRTEPVPHPAPMIDYDEADIPPSDVDQEHYVDFELEDQVTVSNASDLGSNSNLDWRALQAHITSDEHCPSCGRDRSTLGYGDVLADWVFISDAPAKAELTARQLHVDRAGQLYEAILLACGLSRDEVYTSSIFKCLAPDDLSMSPQCNKLIHRQIELVQPKVVVVFGEFAAQSILRSNSSLSDLMQHSHHYRLTNQSSCSVIPTFSPQQLLAEPVLKASLWRRLKLVLRQLDGSDDRRAD